MEVKLSVVIITFNEEKNIDRCLSSVKDIADDIVVVDSYSTDNTGEISLANGARFITHSFHNHIDQKNWAITQAKYPHILSLDADEELSDELKDSIRKIKKNWEFDGFYFNRMTNYCGKWIRHTTWYPSRKLRLWDSRQGTWGGLNPHDRFILDSGATKKHLKGDILHYSYYHVSEHEAQLEKFSTILARSYYETGVQTSMMKRWIHVGWRFFFDYFIRLGFLEGKAGYMISKLSAREVWKKYSKLRDLYREERWNSRMSEKTN